jgi:fructokinase
LIDGRPVHGLVHPEMGHVRVPHDRAVDPFTGTCPFHGDCLEGLASGPALQARWGVPAESLPPDHPAWALEARYLALALHNYVCTLSPERIVIGGGVAVPDLLTRVRRELATLLNGYIQTPALAHGLDGYVVAPALGHRSGVLGALAMAARLAIPRG